LAAPTIPDLTVFSKMTRELKDTMANPTMPLQMAVFDFRIPPKSHAMKKNASGRQRSIPIDSAIYLPTSGKTKS
jgi:hypothetical protein